MIPVLGVPHLNRPELLAAMLASLDVPVDRLVIVDNARTDADSAISVDLPGERPRIIDPGWNLGVAASWNLVLKVTPDAPWWAFANNDVTFAPGDLATLVAYMDGADGPTIGMLVEFGAFALNAAALGAIGYFDESYVPVYAEDADYRWRAELAGVPVVTLPSSTSHVGSACWVGTRYAADLARTRPGIDAYHLAKWGGPPWDEVYRTPFDAGGDLRDWRLDPRRLKEQAWR